MPVDGDMPPDAPGAGKITRNAGIFAAGTLASRVTGFVRDASIVAVFGSGLADVWFLAWTLPNALRRLVGEGSLTISFVPLFTGELRESKAAATTFANRTFTVAAGLLAVLVTAGILLMPGIIDLLASDWQSTPGRYELAVVVGRWAFPYLWFIGLVAVAMGALNSVGRFFVPAVSQVLLNVMLIAAALVGSKLVDPPLLALAWAALIGGALQLLVNLVALARAGHRPRADFHLRDPRLWRLLLLMAPATLGASIHQVNLLVSRGLAASVEPGAITWLYSANLIADLPLGLFAVSMAVASLPALSAHVAAGDMDAYKRTLADALRKVLFVTLPSAVGLATLALPTVAVVFQRGEFVLGDSIATADALRWYAASVPAVGCTRIVVQGFYALKDTRTPVVVGVVTVVAFVSTALGLMPSHGHVGIAMAATLAAYVNLGTNLLLLRRKTGRIGLSRLLSNTVRFVLGAALMGPTVWWVSEFGSWDRGAGSFDTATLINVSVLGGAVLAGALVYALVTVALGSEDARAMTRLLQRKLRRGDKKP